MIAIVTGATGGIGYEFVRYLLSEGKVDEVWAVARNEEKLEHLRIKYGEKVIPVAADLGTREGLRVIEKKLAKEHQKVKYLINNAGVARFARSDLFTAEEISATIDINCKAPLILTKICLPYMKRGSRILNVSSASSFQPTPFINLYASTKVFLRYYSRALGVELKKKGIVVTAVCPGWVDTEMLLEESNGNKIHFPGITSAENVVKTALRDSKLRRPLSICTGYAKFLYIYGKLMPDSVVMRQWMWGIRKYI